LPKKEDLDRFNSNEWNWFVHEFFERSDYMQWHDGVDPSVVLKLNDEERELAEDLLIESMKENAQWPTRALAMMKSKKAIPTLKEKLKNSWGIIRLRVAFALEKIEENGEYIKYILHELRENASPYDRLEAAMNLREFPTPEVIEALYAGMLDEDYLVRNHSSDSLLGIHGFPPDVYKQKKIFDLIRTEKEKGKTTSEDYKLAVKLMKEKVKNRKPKPYP